MTTSKKATNKLGKTGLALAFATLSISCVVAQDGEAVAPPQEQMLEETDFDIVERAFDVVNAFGGSAKGALGVSSFCEWVPNHPPPPQTRPTGASLEPAPISVARATPSPTPSLKSAPLRRARHAATSPTRRTI